MTFANFVFRFIAYLIDGFIVTAFSVGTMFLYISVSQERAADKFFRGVGQSGLATEYNHYWIFIMTALLFAILYGMLEVFFSRSPGKALLGLQILDEQGYESGIGQRLVRASVKYFSLWATFVAQAFLLVSLSTPIAFVNFLIFLGYFMALGPKGQALHDKVASTYVD